MHPPTLYLGRTVCKSLSNSAFGCYQINFLFLNEHVDWHSEVLTWIVTCTGDVYLRQLFRDSPEHMVVEIPGLGQVLDVLRSLVLPTPLLGLHQVTTISLWSKTLNEYTNVSLRSNKLNEYTNLSLRSNILNVYTTISLQRYTHVSLMTWTRPIIGLL